MPVSFAFPTVSAQSRLEHSQEQKRLAAAVDDSVDADALEDYLLLKIQCAGARPKSRAQIQDAISSLLQSPTPAPPPPSLLQALESAPQRQTITRRSSSLLNVLNAVLAPRKLLNKKRKRDEPAPAPDCSSDKRRRVLGAELRSSPRAEDARRGLLFGLSRVGARRVSAGVDVFGPDGTARSPKRAFSASRSTSSWRLQRAELDDERVKFGLGVGVFSPSSGGASPLVGSLMSLVLSPAQQSAPVTGSPARLAVTSPLLQTPAVRRSMAAFRFPPSQPVPRSDDAEPRTPELDALLVPSLSEVRLPDMAFSPAGLRLSSDSLFGIGMPFDDDGGAQSAIAFPTLPRFEFACSPSPVRFVMPSPSREGDDAHLHGAYPTSPASLTPSPGPGPVARPGNPTPTAASSCATDYERSISLSPSSSYEDEGMGYTFSTTTTDDSALFSPPARGRVQMPARHSTESQDARFALPSWDDDGRSEVDEDAMIVDLGSPRRAAGSGTKWDPRRWSALARVHQTLLR